MRTLEEIKKDLEKTKKCKEVFNKTNCVGMICSNCKFETKCNTNYYTFELLEFITKDVPFDYLKKMCDVYRQAERCL